MTNKEVRVSRWYFGGLASGGAAFFTHPLDLIKVHLQTQQEGTSSIIQMSKNIVRKEGVLALYSGLSASLCRQLTYSTTRFGMYEVIKQNTKSDTFYAKIGIAAVSGAAGGFVGTPADMINVRMQNDIKLPIDKRRNYKHAIDGLIRVYGEEGVARLFSGASTATARAVLMTIGQLSFYDQIKYLLLSTSFFTDNMTTHFLSSLSAGFFATILTQPVDVIKTRSMNAKPGEFKNVSEIILYTAKLGPKGFYKGFIPAFTRLGIHTIITYIMLEQMRIHYGYRTNKGAIATSLTQPLDVLKTRSMNAKPGEFKNLAEIVWYTAKLGPLGFFKGYIPAFIRLAPQTILTFLFLEQLRINFGILQQKN